MGHLTSLGRDEWAVARAGLKGFSPVNKATLFEVNLIAGLNSYSCPGSPPHPFVPLGFLVLLVGEHTYYCSAYKKKTGGWKTFFRLRCVLVVHVLLVAERVIFSRLPVAGVVRI